MDLPDFIMQPLLLGDLHSTTTRTNWLDLYWISSVTLKQVLNIYIMTYFILYIFFFCHYFAEISFLFDIRGDFCQKNHILLIINHL